MKKIHMKNCFCYFSDVITNINDFNRRNKKLDKNNINVFSLTRVDMKSQI